MRDTTAARGYGHQHQAERRGWAPTVEAGEAWCAEVICLEPDRWIEPGTPWDLAHNRDTGGYLGPAHERCNRAEGARYRNRRADRPRRWIL